MQRAIRTLPSFVLFAVIAAAVHAQPGIGTCEMGESRDATFGGSGLYGYGPLIYQWIDPTTCGFCLVSDGAIELRTVEIEAFSTIVPVTLVATVSVVGWKGSASCPFPDDAVVLIPPQRVTFTVPASLSGRFALRAPIAGSPQFFRPAFLRLEFQPTGLPAPNQTPALGQISSLLCTSCRQYEDVRYQPGLEDACSGGVYAPFVLRARGDCVAVTAARPESWGRVKAFYR